MTRTLSATIMLVALVATLGYSPRAMAEDVRLCGYTHAWLMGDKYKALPDVTVTVTRSGSVVDTTTSKLNCQKQAEFELKLRGGEPIHVFFYLSTDYVPEVQSLSAVPGLEHRISVALMTVKQYREMQKRNPSMVPLKEKLRCLAKMVPEGHPLYKQLQEMLRKRE